jgi:hypothetical protein
MIILCHSLQWLFFAAIGGEDHDSGIGRRKEQDLLFFISGKQPDKETG